MTERLIHYSCEPLGPLRSETPLDRNGGIFKPGGLWVSVEGDDDWLQWCKGEQFGFDRLAHATEIILKPTAKIFRITTGDELIAFSNEYATTNDYGGVGLSGRSRDKVDWARLTETHQGIIIAPYQYAHRLDFEHSWYYPWDCASGCIWDAANAVAETKTLEPPDIKTEEAA